MIGRFSMDALISVTRRTFASLAIRNYRLYFIGQAISLTGTWMQTVAQGWLVLELTGSGVQLGAIIALQFVPMMLLGLWGGLIADRLDRQSIFYWTQALFGILTFVLGVLVYTGDVQLWMIYVFVLCFGFVRAFDQPARQMFVAELVDAPHMQNAISLNATLNNLTRLIGPMIAGILIATTSLALCFLFNGVSYLAAIIVLIMMRREELHKIERSERKPGQILEGLRYAWHTPLIRDTLLLAATLSIFVWEFQVSLPLLASRTFLGDARSYGTLLAAMGIGSMIGGLFSAARATIAPHHLIHYTFLFAGSVVLLALMPTFTLAVCATALIGFFAIQFTSLGQTLVQTECIPQMRGRVMSLWSMAFIGTTAFGSIIVGAFGEFFGARLALGVGGIIALVAAAIARTSLLRRDEARPISVQTALISPDAAGDTTKAS